MRAFWPNMRKRGFESRSHRPNKETGGYQIWRRSRFDSCFGHDYGDGIAGNKLNKGM